MLLRRSNDPEIQAIADRVRGVITRLPGHSPDAAAEGLGVSVDLLRALIDEPRRTIDPDILIDLVAALVYHSGIDPKWLLTGEYDSTLHRQALLLGEDRSFSGMAAVREFISQQYRQKRRPRFFLTLALPKSVAQLLAR